MDRAPCFDRRGLLGALGATTLFGFAGTARAALLGGSLLDLLGQASDTSLDKLAQPGAFYADPATRISLPLIGHATGGLGGLLMGALDTGQKLGITDNVVRKLNDAAGFAAKEAKPVFRDAIGKMRITDVPDIATKREGATQYLRTSAGTELHGKLRPLIDQGLSHVGAYRQVDRLANRLPLLKSAGITRDKLGNSVTEQALNGIFAYIGAEEGRLRDNPIGAATGVLKGLFGN